jgi:alpha-glucosidase (family GH31 glycosyl hydrolase)
VIRHRPGGRGHAYLPSLDQRLPVIPKEGDSVEIRAAASPHGEAPVVELGDGSTVVMARLDVRAAEAGGDGHLAEAAEAGEDIGEDVAWSADLGVAGGAARYRITRSGEATEWFEFVAATWHADRGTLHVHGRADRLITDSVEWLVDGVGVRRVRFGLRLDPGQAVMGLGERFHAVDQRGHVIDTAVFEQYRGQGARTYLPMPFAIVAGGDGWGLWIDTTRRCWFDVAATEPDVISVAVSLGGEPEVSLHLWEGPPARVLSGFLDATGRPRPVPDWALRPWMSGNEWNTQERVLAEVRRSFEEDIPVGVVVVEAWSDEATFTIFRDAEYGVHTDASPHRLADFTFPESGAWPDPRGMVDTLHDLGVKVLLWQIPLLPDHEGSAQLDADRATLVERRFAVREVDGTPYTNRGWWFPKALLPDFTSEDATRWWIEKRRYLLDDVGIDGFKTDGGEHAWGDELRYANGTRGDETNNLFPNLYAGAYHRLLAGTDAITFSRAGFTGAGTFPAHWAGDERSTWEGFRASVIAGQTAGVSGVFSWSWDLAGFSGEIPDPELYLRAAAMATFCPIMQYHSEFNHHRTPSRDRTPWNIAERHDAPEVMEVFRRFAHLRERLVPYLSAELRAGIESAVPLMRPLAFDWPDDDAVWDWPHQYLLGSALLVAPVVEPGVETWAVYLPAGSWVDVWSDDRIQAGVRPVAAPIDRIPVFCRSDRWPELSAVFDAFIGGRDLPDGRTLISDGVPDVPHLS